MGYYAHDLLDVSSECKHVILRNNREDDRSYQAGENPWRFSLDPSRTSTRNPWLYAAFCWPIRSAMAWLVAGSGRNGVHIVVSMSLL